MVGSRSPPPFHFLCNYKLPCISEEVGVISIGFIRLSHFFYPGNITLLWDVVWNMFFPFVSARMLLLLNSWCNISPTQKAERR